MTEQPALYRSFVLRLWRNSDDETWRLMLRSSQEETPHYFKSADALLAYLTALMEKSVDASRRDSA